MPPSHLKALKASLHQKGILGEQKSKKNRRQTSLHRPSKDDQSRKAAALQSLREQFNPFEVRPAKQSKYAIANESSGLKARPGVTRGLGEEKRKSTLLLEVQNRKRVGGITDRRFGENDPTIAPEEKAIERYVQERHRASKKNSVFDLDADDNDEGLTHLGRSLELEARPINDDFQEAFSDGSVENGDWPGSERPSKRFKASEDNFLNPARDGAIPDPSDERPKSRKEIMEEVIKKSKLYKYERQQAKDDDEDLRNALDKGLPDLFKIINQGSTPSGDAAAMTMAGDAAEANGTEIHPDRLALLNGKPRTQSDKDYDERLRQMTMDQRAQPTTRTLTAEEKAKQDADRLKDLEERRLKRMRGEPDSSDSEPDVSDETVNTDKQDEEVGDDQYFGLGKGLSSQQPKPIQDVEGEDDFVYDDIIADEAEGSLLASSDEDTDSEAAVDDNDDTEFIGDLLSKEDLARPDLLSKPQGSSEASKGLAFTFPCPSTLSEFLEITRTINLIQLPTVIQRIRILYQPQLAEGNKAKLGSFTQVLVQFLHHLANDKAQAPASTLEATMRHLHSLSKSFPAESGGAFRDLIQSMHEQRPQSLNAGDLIILTAITTIFPTSDHFHQIVTPALLCMTRYIGQKVPKSVEELMIGLYVSTLTVEYQKLSKRYVPETTNYVANALSAMMPLKPKISSVSIPDHWPNLDVRARLRGKTKNLESKSSSPTPFWAIRRTHEDDTNNELRTCLLWATLGLIDAMVDIWKEKTAFCEIFDHIRSLILFLTTPECLSKLDESTTELVNALCEKLEATFETSSKSRQPLRLHNHRPLPIKTSIPKFEESYNPHKRYDPDTERAELSRLKAEHKKERKGALRELRKDASFLARESLREKKERDAAYDKKFKRLVAEIQGEEGREAKIYEKEKKMRTSSRK